VTTSGSGRFSRRLRWIRPRGNPGRLAAAALALAALATGVGGATGATAAAGATAPPATAAAKALAPFCPDAVGPFSVQGTKVVGQGGKTFVSYGITVPGLLGPRWSKFLQIDLQKIAATALGWCGNTVRLQLSQDNLLGPSGTGFNKSYMNAIQDEVSAAVSDDLVVVLNDSTEDTPAAVRNAQKGPTPATETFWKDLAKVYGSSPQVIFDLFNEPRMYSPGMSLAQEWQLWLNGGRFDGVYYPFGMAQLAQYVRTTLSAQNLFWIEGPDNSDSFAGMVSQGARLKVSGVVYALHHPAGAHDPAAWNADFGYLVSTGVAPVVDGEWTNYEPAPTSSPTAPRSSCWPDAPTAVPAFLQYLASRGIGLNAYQLQPGYLIKSYSNLAGPTTIDAGTWSCQSAAERQPGQGAGSQVMAWFKQHDS
jgi:Cellulase (glycosyl hydrolase family 5)